MKKGIAAIYFYLFCFTSVLADRSDYGRDFDNSTGGFFSQNPIGRMIALIVSIICAICLIISVYNDDKQDKSDKGCLIVFFILLIAIGISCCYLM
jgi:hypothetical protein